MSDFTPADPAMQAAFRNLMGRFATGVCIVSCVPARVETGGETGSGHPPIAAMTVNSFVSVSLDPMLVSWSLQNESSRFDAYFSAERFTISILAESQQTIARRYAARGNTGLVAEDFKWTRTSLPVVKDALGHIECRQWSTYPAGDHTMIFGEVMAMAMPEGDGAAPLGFFGGRFCRISD